MTNDELLLQISNAMQIQLHPVNERLDRINTQMGKLEEGIGSLEKQMNSMGNRMDLLESGTEKLESQIKQTEVLIEDQVLPMQRELSSYGASVYRRYEEAADQTAVMEKNLQVLMHVVAEHSGKLEQLC